MRKIVLLLLIFSLLVSVCACTPTGTGDAENTNGVQATLIPRRTMPPTPAPTYTTFVETQNEILSMITFAEETKAKEEKRQAPEITSRGNFESENYYYVFASKITDGSYTSCVYQLKKEDNGYRLLLRADAKTGENIANECTYDFFTAQLNGETVFISVLSSVYGYYITADDGSRKVMEECETPEDILLPNYEQKRTKPTKLQIEFSDGTFYEQYQDGMPLSKIMLAQKGSLTIKNLSVWAGTRRLTKAEIVNYQVPQYYHVREAVSVYEF